MRKQDFLSIVMSIFIIFTNSALAEQINETGPTSNGLESLETQINDSILSIGDAFENVQSVNDLNEHAVFAELVIKGLLVKSIEAAEDLNQATGLTSIGEQDRRHIVVPAALGSLLLTHMGVNALQDLATWLTPEEQRTLLFKARALRVQHKKIDALWRQENLAKLGGLYRELPGLEVRRDLQEARAEYGRLELRPGVFDRTGLTGRLARGVSRVAIATGGLTVAVVVIGESFLIVLHEGSTQEYIVELQNDVERLDRILNLSGYYEDGND